VLRQRIVASYHVPASSQRLIARFGSWATSASYNRRAISSRLRRLRSSVLDRSEAVMFTPRHCASSRPKHPGEIAQYDPSLFQRFLPSRSFERCGCCVTHSNKICVAGEIA
jgi:hypothetical protein